MQQKDIDQLKNGRYYYVIDDMIIATNVEEVLSNGKDVTIQFEAGDVSVKMKNIKKVKGEEENISRYKWVYKLKNKKGEYLGYVAV